MEFVLFFVFCVTFAGFLMYSVLSDERMGLQLTQTIAPGPCHISHYRVQVPSLEA
jgi:hypothetical protein